MVEISFAEFKELPKKKVNKNSLQPGKKYYIINTSTRYEKTIPVLKGTFIQKVGDRYDFSDVEFVVNPFKEGGKPTGFYNRRELKFYEVIEPGETEKNNKYTTINELNEFISEKRAEPHDITPTISFMGKDYRKAKKTFDFTFKKPVSSKKTSPPSKKTSSSSKKTSSSSKKTSPPSKINRISSPSTISSKSSSKNSRPPSKINSISSLSTISSKSSSRNSASHNPIVQPSTSRTRTNTKKGGNISRKRRYL
jgi:hypothetical protein